MKKFRNPIRGVSYLIRTLVASLRVKLYPYSSSHVHPASTPHHISACQVATASPEFFIGALNQRIIGSNSLLPPYQKVDVRKII